MRSKFIVPEDKTIVDKLKTIIRPSFCYFKKHYISIRARRFGKDLIDFKQVPIIINNFNRLEMLVKLINALEERGYTNIYILDNASTYPPLLEYYKSCKYEVVFLNKNVGYLALWQTDVYKRFYSGYYIYTDPDVVMVDDCPDDFVELMYNLLQKYPYCMKVGLSLKIDDLPDYYHEKAKVLEWEKQFWKYEVENNVFEAPVDTTFALYRPFVKWGANSYIMQLRTGYPYQLHHLPWYSDMNNLTEEELFYKNNSRTSTHWTSLQQ